MNIFSQIGQRVLEKSRAYYFPVQKHSEEDWESLNDEAFAAMLKEIDAFTEQFRLVQAANESSQAQAD